MRKEKKRRRRDPVSGLMLLKRLASAMPLLLMLSVAAEAQTNALQQEVAIRDRSNARFRDAFLFKPSDSGTNELVFGLAPLIIQEVSPAGNQTNATPERFGRFTTRHGQKAFDATAPAVYYSVDTVEVRGKPHARFCYLWCYPPRATTGQRPQLLYQGVRLTLDSSGRPAVWELLADTSGQRIFFVSRSLESAAAEEFGLPPPGRCFAVERPLADAPQTVVARVIEDGPVPMGPIVYLCAGTRDVSTLICRCMPAQAGNLLGSGTYALVPFQSIASIPLIAGGVSANSPTVFWPGQDHDGRRLESCLRLPRDF